MNESKVYLFYDHKVIGVVDQKYRNESMGYFLDTIFMPNPDGSAVVAQVNAIKEREEAFDYFLPKPKGSAIPNFEHKK